MRLHARLSALADALPDGASITLDASALRAWLAEELAHLGGRVPLEELTLEEIAAECGVTTDTVRDWKVPGAYRVGRVTRVPLASWLAFKERRQREQGGVGASAAPVGRYQLPRRPRIAS